jgi:hypothetical protein
VPDPLTQRCLEEQLQEFLFGEYLDAAPERWLIWHGRGIFGPTRYACPDHRGDLKADLREHYGTLGWHPWAMGPHRLSTPTRGKVRPGDKRRLAGPGSWGVPG